MIPFRFAATVEISGLVAISDVLVCRTPWDSLCVEKDRNILLGKDRAAAQRFVSEWREKAVQAAIEAMQLVREKEVESFGDRSYFYYLDRQTLYNIPMPEISDDEYNEEDRP